MWNLIKNELLKLSRNGKVYIVVGFMVLVVTIQCYTQYMEITAKSPERVIEECQRLIETMKNTTVVKVVKGDDTNSDTENGDDSDDSDDSDAKIYIENAIESAKKEIERARKKLENMNREWKVNVKEEIASLEELKEELIAEGNLERLESTNTKINMLNYYLEHNLKPDEEHVMKNTVIVDIMTYVGSVFLAIIVVMLTVETLAAENSSGTIKLLITKPVSRGNIYISKYLTSLIASLGIVITIEVVAYLIIGIIFGFGNLQAPVAIGPRYVPDPVQIARYGMGVKPVLESTILIPLWQKLIIVLVLQILFIITVVSFGIFVSAFMKNGISAIIFGLLITAILTVMTVQVKGFGSIKVLSFIMPFLFSTYSAGELILTGYLSRALNSTLINIPFATLVLIAWAGLFFMLGYRIFTRKDVLG